MQNINKLLASLNDVISFLELDSQQSSETDPMLEEVNKALVLLRHYQDELIHTSELAGEPGSYQGRVGT